MTIIRITSITPKDYKKILGYHREHVRLNFPDSVVRPHLFKKQLEANIKDRHAYFFLVKDEKKDIVAFFWFRIENDPYKLPRPYRYLDLRYIHVDPHSRGKGIGSGIMEFVNVFAKQKKCREVRLGTFAGNNASIHLYKKYGFEIYRVIMRSFL